MLTALLDDELSDISITDESDDEAHSNSNDDTSFVNKHETLQSVVHMKALSPSLNHASSGASSKCTPAIGADEKKCKTASDSNTVNNNRKSNDKIDGDTSQCLIEQDDPLNAEPLTSQSDQTSIAAGCANNATKSTEDNFAEIIYKSSSITVGGHTASDSTTVASKLDVKTSMVDDDDNEGSLKLQNINPVSKMALSEKESRLFNVPERLIKAHR